MVGRDDELAAVTSTLSAVPDGAARVVLIEGEPGIGKTELLNTVVAEVAPSFRVLEGCGHELERERPFGILADALELGAQADDPERVAIRRLLAGGSAPETFGPVDFPVLRFQVVEAILELIDGWATTEPVLLALEDLHWADPSTLVVISQLARRLADRPVGVTATLRPSRRSAALEPLKRELSEETVVHVTLDPLPDEAVCDLAAEALGAPPGPVLSNVLEGAAGNPFFATELLAALADDDSVDVSDGVAEIPAPEPPASLHLTILRRLGFLPGGCLEALRVASVLGSRFSLADLSAVLAKPATDLLGTLEDALEAGFLVESGDALAFRHDLVRDAIYQDLPQTARKAFHLQAARLLAAAGRDASRVAPHFLAGAFPGDREAIAWLERAAEDALLRAPDSAVELLTGAAELCGDQVASRDRLLVDLTTALMWSGQLDRAEALLEDIVGRPHDPAVDSRIRLALMRVLILQGKAQGAAQRCNELSGSTALVGRDRARALTDAATARLLAGDVDGAQRDGQWALEEGRRLGDDWSVCGALGALSWVANLRGRTTEAIEIGEQAVAVAESSPLRETGRRYPHYYLGVVLMDADRLEEGLRMFDVGRRMAEAFGDSWQLPLGHWGAMLTDLYAGRLSDAATALEAANAVTEEIGTRAVAVWASAVGAHLAIHRDNLTTAEELLAEGEQKVAEAGPGVGFDWLLWARALLYETDGDAASAADTLRQAWDLAADLGIISQRRLMGPDLARLLLAVDDIEGARGVADAMAEAAELSGVASTRGTALRCRGLVDRDPDVLLESVAAYQEGPRRMGLASSCEDAGRMLASVSRSDDARELLGEAATLYSECGAARDERRVDAELRALGVARGRREPRSRPATGWESLTATELGVSRLAAEGLTNPEIGRRLFISPRTVETHLSHVFAKLGVSSRVELAAEAAQRNG